jgi:hypothetical protein
MRIFERWLGWLFPEVDLRRAKARIELQRELSPSPVLEKRPKAEIDPWRRDDRRQRSIEKPELF